MPTRKKSRITAEDLYRFQLITDCQISPDGKHVIFCVQWVDRKTEKKYTNLWVVPTGGGRARQFTYGDQSDSQPRWSPDSSEIAFISNRGDEKQPQIYLIPFHGGEARPLTNLKGAIGPFEWSPDGKGFICQLRKKDKEDLEREQDEQKKKLGVVARHVQRVFFKEDGVGFLPKERWHIWSIDARTGKAKQLTDGEVYDEYSPRWSHDGQEIVFCSNRTESPDLEPDVIDLFVMPADGGDFRKIETPLGPKRAPSFSPDGKLLAYLGHEGKGQWWKNTRLWVVPADGSGAAKNLTAKFDFNVSSWTINDMPSSLAMIPPTWSKDGSKLYFQVAHHGNTALKSVALEGDAGSLETVIGDKGVVGTFTFDKEQSKLAYFHADMTDPGQVWVRNMASGNSRQLTHVNGNLLRARDLGEIEEVWFKGAADNDLQGWVLKPPDFDEAKKYPSILEIHGGPRVQYGNFFMHEFYYLAANDYIVYFCNPRGGQGYGEEHAKSIWNNWGTADYDDLMAWVDFVQQKAYIDTARMGVTGGSYGGYMTNWIIGHTDRFKAAVTQRCVSNLISMYGSSDFNWAFQMEFGDEPPWENLDNYWQQSPMKYIGNVKTPTLVIHSEQDLRCAIEQGEQIFVALKKLGVETEMVRFPDEPHGLSRGGRTDRRIERLNHIRRWFDRYLQYLFKVGVSLRLGETPDTDENLNALIASRMEHLEIGYSPYCDNPVWAESVLAKIDGTQLNINSVHAPFSREVDISRLDDGGAEFAMQAIGKAIVMAQRLGADIVVLHGSAEPIEEGERAARLARSKSSLRLLGERAQTAGVKLALEMLPRTCLGNTADELEMLLADVPPEQAGFCLDTNHLAQPGELPATVKRLSERLITLHISDYDGVDERHWMPFRGLVNWAAFANALRDSRYSGAFIYEAGLEGETMAQKLANVYSNFQRILSAAASEWIED